MKKVKLLTSDVIYLSTKAMWQWMGVKCSYNVLSFYQNLANRLSLIYFWFHFIVRTSKLYSCSKRLSILSFHVLFYVNTLYKFVLFTCVFMRKFIANHVKWLFCIFQWMNCTAYNFRKMMMSFLRRADVEISIGTQRSTKMV